MDEFPQLFQAAFTQPAIDNHAHPLLRQETRHELAFEGLISEAQGEALTEDAVFTLACYRATKQLAKLYGLHNESSWDDVKRHRATMDYSDLCKLCFKEAGIISILIDDGLGDASIAEDYKWHDRLTNGYTRRIVRVEIEAEEILIQLLAPILNTDTPDLQLLLDKFEEAFEDKLKKLAGEIDVVGFKSIVCYRTGMNVTVSGTRESKILALAEVYGMARTIGSIRLAHKALNDEVVRIALLVAGQCNIPVQFHTGLGDNDISLMLSSPSHLQPIIKSFPETKIVLLHSSYPYTRDAGYLTAVYKNVYLDFGEVFPFVSGEGQRSIIRQVLELCPTNKIMWSSDGHWWPESYYLGIVQARKALYEVLADQVRRKDIDEREGVSIIKNSLFYNAERVYGLRHHDSYVETTAKNNDLANRESRV